MLSPDYRVSYISSIGQHVSVNFLTIIMSIRAKVCHMQQNIMEHNGIPLGFTLFSLMAFVQAEHKFFPWLQTFITRKLPGHVRSLCCTSVRRVSAMDNFPTRWCTSALGFRCSSVFGRNISKQVDWERWSDTLATTIAGYHPPWLLFMGGMLRTKCFRNQLQILQIWRQE